MKKVINYLKILLISIMCLSMSLIVVACESPDDPPPPSVTGTPPTYKGMTVSTQTTQTASFASYFSRSSNITLIKNDNGLHGNPHYIGDWWGKHDEVDQENPFDKEEGQDGIEEEVSSSLQVTGPAEQIYFANQNQAIYVTVKLENPDDFEIESFTLNGTKYASYMFEQGSDLENLILKVTVPANAEGILQYTLDAIKYIDGTTIKDVALTGDKTVDVGVYNPVQPVATISNQVSDFYSLSFSANITDTKGVAALTGGSFKAVLYDGENVIDTKDLVVGNNNVTFSNLKINKVYQYAVVGLYDNFNGDGATTHILAKKAVYTKTAVAFNNIDIKTNSIAYTLKWDEAWAGKTLTSLQLFKGETKVRDLAVNTTSINDLLSNSQYSVVATYINKGVDEKVSLTFSTLANSVPTADIAFVSKTQNSITFAVAENDLSNVGQIVAVKALLNGYVESEIENVSQTTITGLLSGKTYTVELTYQYDLGDGSGVQTIKKTFETTTGTYVAPTVTATKGVENKTSLTFEFNETDVDNVGYIETISLLNAQGNVVKTLDDKSLREFTGLLSNTDYVVSIVYAFDLNDGNGKQTITKTLNYRTVAMQRPTAYVTSSTSYNDKVGFDIIESDPDNIGEVVAIKLYKGNELVQTATDLSVREFTGLFSANAYTVQVDYQYNMNDGSASVTQNYVHTVSTKAKQQPSIFITSPGERSHAIEFAISETDVDNVGSIAEIALLLNGVEVATATEMTQTVFEGLAYGTTYTLRVTYIYDLNNGLGEQSIVKTQDIATAPRAQYTVSFNVAGGTEIEQISQWEQDSITLPIASKGGHTFIEWKESDESVGDTTYTVTKDVTLTAVYGPYNPAYEYNYYASKYEISGPIAIQAITFSNIEEMFTYPAEWLVYIDSEDAGAKARFQRINQIAIDYGVVIHHFNPDLAGGYGNDVQEHQELNLIKELTGISAGSFVKTMQDTLAQLFHVSDATQINDHTLYAVQGSTSRVYLNDGNPYESYTCSIKGSCLYSANPEATIATIATRKPGQLPNATGKDAYNTSNIKIFNSFADIRFHMYANTYVDKKTDVFVELATYEQYAHLLENGKGRFVVLFGSYWCPNTQAIIKLVNDIAQDYGVDRIYFFTDVLGGAPTINALSTWIDGDGNMAIEAFKNTNASAMRIQTRDTDVVGSPAQDEYAKVKSYIQAAIEVKVPAFEAYRDLSDLLWRATVSKAGWMIADADPTVVAKAEQLYPDKMSNDAYHGFFKAQACLAAYFNTGLMSSGDLMNQAETVFAQLGISKTNAEREMAFAIADTIDQDIKDTVNANYVPDTSWMKKYNYNYLFAKFMTNYMSDFKNSWSGRTIDITYNGDIVTVDRIPRPTLLMYQAQENGPAKVVADVSWEYVWVKGTDNGTSIVGSAQHTEARAAIKSFFDKHSYVHYREVAHTNPVHWVTGGGLYRWGYSGMSLEWQYAEYQTIDWYGTNA